MRPSISIRGCIRPSVHYQFRLGTSDASQLISRPGLFSITFTRAYSNRRQVMHQSLHYLSLGSTSSTESTSTSSSSSSEIRSSTEGASSVMTNSPVKSDSIWKRMLLLLLYCCIVVLLYCCIVVLLYCCIVAVVGNCFTSRKDLFFIILSSFFLFFLIFYIFFYSLMLCCQKNQLKFKLYSN